jgi:predicted DNA-binding transcriptional regulator YafY
MIETSARLLRLLGLLQARRTWSGAEIAERLGVSTRTVRRDIEKLRELDYPVSAERGIGDGYRLGAGGQLPPLLLDDEEAVAVAITLRTAAASGVTGIGETALRALVKLEQVLPSRLRNRVRSMQVSTVEGPGRGPTVDAGVLLSVAAACRDHRRLRFDYVELAGAASVHVIEPHELITWASRWYLVAWDVERKQWTSFQVDRMRLRYPTGAAFTPRTPPSEAAATHVARSIAQLWPDQATIRMRSARRRSRQPSNATSA